MTVTPGSAGLLAKLDEIAQSAEANSGATWNNDRNTWAVHARKVREVAEDFRLAAKPAPQNRDDLLALKSRLALASPKFRVGGDVVEISFADCNECRLLVDGALAGGLGEEGRDILQIVLKVYGFTDKAIASDWIKRSHAYSIATQIASALSPTGAPKS